MTLLRQQTKPGILSLVFSREFAPVELGGEGKKIPGGLPCPVCTSRPAGALGRHGSYLRTFKSFSGPNQTMSVMRLLCSKCGTSQACLFEHWLPYKRYSSESQAQLVEPYFLEEESYDQLGWQVSTDEGEGHRHLAFTVVARLAEMCEWITSLVERQRHKHEAWLWKREEPEPPGNCPNAYKAKTAKKQAALNQVKEALVKLKKLSGGKQESMIELLLQIGMGLRTPVSLLTCARVVQFQIATYCLAHNAAPT